MAKTSTATPVTREAWSEGPSTPRRERVGMGTSSLLALEAWQELDAMRVGVLGGGCRAG